MSQANIPIKPAQVPVKTETENVNQVVETQEPQNNTEKPISQNIAKSTKPKSLNSILDEAKTTKKIVIIYRTKKATSRIPKGLIEDSVWEYGPGLTSSGDVQRGLPIELEQFIMPRIVGVSSTDPNFESKVRNWYYNRAIRVPADIGKKLDISTYKKVLNIGGEQVEVDYPVNALDFIDYNISKGKKFVASSEKEALSNPNRYQYYMVDEADEKAKEKVKLKAATEAMAKFVELTTGEPDLTTLMHILDLTAHIHKSYEYKTGDPIDVIKVLKATFEADPVGFLSVANDPKLETKALILECIDNNIINKIGNDFYDLDQVIGSSLEDAATYLDAEKHSAQKLKIQSRLNQMKRA